MIQTKQLFGKVASFKNDIRRFSDSPAALSQLDKCPISLSPAQATDSVKMLYLNRLKSEIETREMDFQDACIEIKDTDPFIREEAAERMGALKVKRAVPLLLEACSDEYNNVREASLQALGEYHAPEILAVLEKAVKDPCPEVREIAIKALGHWGSAGIGSLKKGLLDADLEIRKAAVESLLGLDFDLDSLGIEEKICLLELDTTGFDRGRAVSEIFSEGTDEQKTKAIEVLVEGEASDPKSDAGHLRSHAFHLGCGKLGLQALIALPELETIEHEDFVDLFLTIAKKDPSLLEAIEEGEEPELNEQIDYDDVRETVARTLDSAESPPEEMIFCMRLVEAFRGFSDAPLLFAQLGHGNERVAEAALSCLGGLINKDKAGVAWGEVLEYASQHFMPDSYEHIREEQPFREILFDADSSLSDAQKEFLAERMDLHELLSILG
jgi:hypothetical protein